MLSKIDENFSQLASQCSNQTTLESISFINGLSIDGMSATVRSATFCCYLLRLSEISIVAGEILTQYLTARECKPRELLIMKFEI